MPSRTTQEDLRTAIVEAATELLASRGLRAASLRTIAHRAGCSVVTLLAAFGTKDKLVSACLEGAIERDRAAIEMTARAGAELGVDRQHLAALLWTLVEDAGGARRRDTLALLELLTQASNSLPLRAQVRAWMVQRRDAFRTIGDAMGCDPAASDMLMLIVLSESCFAVSCAPATEWRVAASCAFDDAVRCLTGRPAGQVSANPGEAIAARFHRDPGPLAAESEVEGRGPVSRRRIIDAAATLVETDGLAAVTNRAVATLAGVSLARTTYHFGSIDELAFAAILRVFERAMARPDVRAAFVDRPTASLWIAKRQHQGAVERVGSRGMVEVSLAAARGLAPAELGLAMRRQRGTITYSALRTSGHAEVGRGRAASHALWTAAVFLVCAALGEEAEALFDFEHQAKLGATVLLGLSAARVRAA